MRYQAEEVNPILKRVRQIKDFLHKNINDLTMEKLDEVADTIGLNHQSPYGQRGKHSN